MPEGLQRPKEAGTRPLDPPGDSCQLPARQALSRSPCTPVTRRPLPEFPLAANSSALPLPHTHAHPRHNTTHTYLHNTHTHARMYAHVHAHRLSSPVPRLRDSQAALTRPLASPWWNTGAQARHWAMVWLWGQHCWPLETRPDPAVVPRFGLAASLHIYLETFQSTAGVPIILHNLCLLRRQKWGCL